MAREPAIRLQNAGKSYDLVTAAGNVFTRFILSRAHSVIRSQEFWAVRGLTLDIAPGSMIGIIGANGSGKSTLLRMIAGITPPSEGTVKVRGRVIAMLEVGLGFHEDLTGYENIYLHGALLGMTHREIDERVGAIVAYAEIAEFMDMPVKHFSTGMRARLGFAVAVHCDPDVLLVDEVLAVGDGHFQLKCLGTMQAFQRAGKTILFVTHNIRHARTLCERILWLDGGRPVMWGPSEEVALAYRRAQCEQTIRPGGNGSGESAAVRIEAVRVTDGEGRERTDFRFGETLVVHLRGVAESPIEAPDLRVTVVRGDCEIAGTATAREAGCAPERLEGAFEWTLRWPAVFLNTADYSLSLTLL
ncbi:ATP-binding cassette domain-containing protein, partial [Candidatus Sumerlaeota bacterium]|nr:ATP-binding cassette domain-containing protein [Candidatus Sumerlaeota bacterium]